MGGFFLHTHCQPSALNHEVADNAVENGISVKFLVHIAQEIGYRGRSLVFKKFKEHIAG